VLFTYRCGELYYPNVDSGIIWNDSTLQVDWPLDRVEKVILSEKDGKLQTFEQFLKNSGGF
jgi:dTDP-4-dehydrorhamnose 3,5-epimerase